MKKLRPLFALFLRAVRDDMRSKVPPIGRALITLLVLFFVVMMNDNSRGGAPGQEVFMMLVMVNLAGMIIFGLHQFCSAITEEKEDDTLGLLRMTDLNPLSILLGKAASRLVAGLMVMVVQLPFALLCVTLGGVAHEDILHVYAVMASVLVFMACTGLLMSVVSKKTAGAVAKTVILSVVLYAVVPFVYALSFSRAFMRGAPAPIIEWWREAIAWLMSVHPVMDIGTTIFGRTGVPFPIGSTVSFHLIASGVEFILAWLLFNRFCSGTVETAPRRKAAGRVGKSGAPRSGTGAVAWKEFWFHTGGHRGLVIRFITYSVLVFGTMALMYAESRRVDADDVSGMIFVIAGICLALELILGAARIAGGERQRNTLSSLVTLPIRTAKILRQKLLGTFVSFLPAVAFLVLAAIIGWEDVEQILHSIARDRDSPYVISIMAAHLFAVPVVTCWFTLVMRRGAIAAAVAAFAILDIVLVVIVNEASGNAGRGFILIGALLIFVVALVLTFRIPRMVESCAAEE